jgi:hypothetical protein
MAFRASNQVPARALPEAKEAALRLRAFAQSRVTAFNAPTIRRDAVVSCWQELHAFSAALKGFRAVPGIAEYAAEQENDEAYDVAAEFNNLIAAVDAAIAHVETAMPKDANGFLAVVQFGAGGVLIPGTFTAAQFATLRSLLTAIANQVV